MKIESFPNIKSVSFYSREELYEYALSDVFKGREELIGDYTEEDNPFSDSYKIVLKDIAKTSETVSNLKTLANVSHVETRQDVANLVIAVSNAVKNLSMLIMIVLLIISVVIISNTVRLTVFNRRKEINIMKYIGATDRFIRMPFIIEGMLIGFLGAIIAFVFVSWGYIVLYSKISQTSFDIVNLVPYLNLAPIISVIFIRTFFAFLDW